MAASAPIKILAVMALMFYLAGSSSSGWYRRGSRDRGSQRRGVNPASTARYANSTRQSPVTATSVAPTEDAVHGSSVSTQDLFGEPASVIQRSSVPSGNATLGSSVGTRAPIADSKTSTQNTAQASSVLAHNSTHEWNTLSEDLVLGSSEMSTRSDGLVSSVVPYGLNTTVWAQTQDLLNITFETAPTESDYRTCLDVMTSTGFNQSGFFLIDPDGPHGAPPFQVFCRLNPSKKERGTTVLETTTSDTLMYVLENAEVDISYGEVDMESIRALVRASESCYQRLSYTCYGAPMWWDESQQVAWVSWNGTVMPNWGGAKTGFPGCKCSDQETNVCSGGGRCHCDSGSGTRIDAGLITDKDTLPVAKLKFNFKDEHSKSLLATSAVLGVYAVGRLKCTGNAVLVVHPTTDAPSTTPAGETTPAGKTTPAGERAPSDGTTSQTTTAADDVSTKLPETTANDAPTTLHHRTTDDPVTVADTDTTTDRPTTGPGSTPATTAAGHVTPRGIATQDTKTTTSDVKAGIRRFAAALVNKLSKFKISAGNTSTTALVNATKTILAEVWNFVLFKDNADDSTTLSVATLLETSMAKIAWGLQENQSVQFTRADTKVELRSFSSSEFLDDYVFSVGGEMNSKTVDRKSKVSGNEEKDEEVTLKISTPSFSHSEGPVKVVVVYQGAVNRTGGRMDEEAQTNTMPNSEGTPSNINSGILTCSVLSEGHPLAVGLDFSLQHQTHSAEGDVSKLVQRSCVFWDTTLEQWSTDGCRMLDSTSGVSSTKTFCSCNHNSSFAVLLQVSERPIDQLNKNSNVDYILTVLSTVLGSLSIFCLAALLILYAYLKLFKFLQIKVHANLAVSLFIGQILFITGVNATENRAACRAITVLLQFFFSATFSWMLVEGGLLFQRAALVSKQPPKIFMLLLIGWGIPLLLTLVSFAIGFRHYGSYGICWLDSRHGQIWAFVSLVIIVILVNTAVVVYVMKTFLSLKMNTDKDNAERIRASARAVAVLVPILGLAWMLGFLQDISPVFQFIFVILNASQGIFVFICHGLMNIEVLKALKRRRSSNKVSACSDSGNENNHSRISTKKTGSTVATERSTKEDRM